MMDFMNNFFCNLLLNMLINMWNHAIRSHLMHINSFFIFLQKF
jgi:hypothetical protein